MSGSTSITVAEHRVFLVFAVTAREHVEGAHGRVTLGHFRKTEILVPGNDAALVHPARKLPELRWIEVEDGLQISKDLDPSVAAALSPHDASSGGTHVPAVELSPAALNLLNGVYVLPPAAPALWSPEEHDQFLHSAKGLRIQWSEAARQRSGNIGDGCTVFLHRVYVVAPGPLALLIAELEVVPVQEGALALETLEEALPVLSNLGRPDSISFAAMKNGKNLDMIGLLTRSLPEQYRFFDSSSRAFVYTAMVLDGFDQERAQAAVVRCAHKYTSAYKVSGHDLQQSIYQPFETVVHACALEGMASAFDSSIGFLAEQSLTRVRQSYLWMAILGRHESIYLRWLLRRCERAQIGSDANRHLIRNYLLFRLRFNIPLASGVEMHNRVLAFLRERMHVRALMDKVAADVIEADRWFNQERAEQFEAARRGRKRQRQRLALVEVLVAGFLMAGVTFIAFDTLIQRLWRLALNQEPSPGIEAMVPLCIAAFAAVLRMYQIHTEIHAEPVEEPTEERLFEAACEGGHEEARQTGEIAAIAQSSQHHH